MTIYENGKIYGIEPINGGDVGDVYYGSTTKKLLSRRFSEHKHQYRRRKEGKCNVNLSSFVLFDKYELSGCQIVLVENVENCKSKDDLHARESSHIRNNECINKNIPTRTYKEWYDDNKNKKIEQVHLYRMEHDEEIKIKKKTYYDKNNEEIRGKRKNYYWSNIEEIREKERQQYHDNKESNNEKDRKRYEESKQNKTVCPCGGIFHHRSKSKHIKTKKHQAFLCNV